MVAVNTVANPTQATSGKPARDAVLSTGLAASTKATLVATSAAAAAVLSGRLRLLKNRRLQPPIMTVFQPSSPNAFERCALGDARSSRYPATANAASMAVQATGKAQSGGLNDGSFNERYHAIVRG